MANQSSPELLAATPKLDRQLVRTTGEGEAYFGVALRAVAPAATEAERPPLNLSFVLDRSGSMTGQKIVRAREAILFALRQLTERDFMSVVAYDDVIELAQPSTRALPAARRAAEAAVGQIGPRNNTNLHDGWLLGLQQVASQQSVAGESALHRCFLLTDGLANTGVTDPAALTAVARDWRARGISTTTFGVGDDFDERLLDDLADAGGGHFHFIAEPADIPNFFRGELGELLSVVARDITLEVWATLERAGATEQVALAPVTRLVTNTTADGALALPLGELDAGGERLVALRVTFPRGSRGEVISLHARVRFASADRAQSFTVDLPTQTLTYDVEAAVAAQPVDEAFLAEVLLLQSAAARDLANEQIRAGNMMAARGTLSASVAMLRAAPMQSSALAAEAEDLDHLVSESRSRGFTPGMSKDSYARSSRLRKQQRDYSAGASEPPAPPAPSEPTDPNALKP